MLETPAARYKNLICCSRHKKKFSENSRKKLAPQYSPSSMQISLSICVYSDLTAHRNLFSFPLHLVPPSRFRGPKGYAIPTPRKFVKVLVVGLSEHLCSGQTNYFL